MNTVLFIIAAIIVIVYIMYSIRKNRLDIANSFIWIIFCIIMLLLAVWPKSIDLLAPIFGVSYAPVLVLTFAVVVLFVMNFSQSKKIEELRKKVIDLGQELSIVKEKQNEKK
ncbi:MAG: DUF2304 domain-containing protein [Bacilli bacterium]|nr:DUF2304 domain-containing protein [Bacilli bacterium]